MLVDKLKLNEDKTELIVIGSRNQPGNVRLFVIYLRRLTFWQLFS